VVHLRQWRLVYVIISLTVIAEYCLLRFCWQIGHGPQLVHDPAAALLGSDGLPLTLKS